MTNVLDLALARAAREPKGFPRPRFTPTVNGTVILTLGSGAEQVEEHLTLAAARALMAELADSIDVAEWLLTLASEAEREGRAEWLERVGKEGGRG